MTQVWKAKPKTFQNTLDNIKVGNFSNKKTKSTITNIERLLSVAILKFRTFCRLSKVMIVSKWQTTNSENILATQSSNAKS